MRNYRIVRFSKKHFVLVAATGILIVYDKCASLVLFLVLWAFVMLARNAVNESRAFTKLPNRWLFKGSTKQSVLAFVASNKQHSTAQKENPQSN